MTNLGQAVKDLQDTLAVIAQIEKRQSAMLHEYAEHLGELLEFRRRGLIGYVAGHQPPAPPA